MDLIINGDLCHIDDSEELQDGPGFAFDSEEHTPTLSRAYSSQEFDFHQQPHRATLDKIDWNRLDLWIF